MGDYNSMKNFITHSFIFRR